MRASLSRLRIYPVKSCAGIELPEATLAETGLEDDRHWMLVRPNGRFVTQRELPRMALIRTRVDAKALSLEAEGSPTLVVPRASTGVSLDVTVWKFDGRGIDCGDEAAAWFSEFLETPLRLVRFDANLPRTCAPEWTAGLRSVTEFSDGFPILVISRASLDELNSRLPRPLPMERFRPNIVLDGVGPYDEDRVHELTTGAVRLRVVKPCTRCAITTTDHERGVVDGVEPLATLKGYRFDRELRGVAFGQNAIIVSGAGSRLSVGDTFDITWK